ncbi:hypothetical protein [Echinicola rosea]|uniref:Uncharacterized protein n=1 Tax=Echinicola rosea TaxID=1807691 RepID=A0ABQ1VAH6_9BACT|nr:hypothetical protein [Echinicola rosea]GGF49079.1 hypothetical protein GCM10011339_42120 [Echinicola rosea]
MKHLVRQEIQILHSRSDKIDDNREILQAFDDDADLLECALKFEDENVHFHYSECGNFLSVENSPRFYFFMQQT